MLTYKRTPIESINALSNGSIAKDSYDMTITPYKRNTKVSITDNAANGIDNTNVVNFAYRYPIFTGVNSNTYLQLFSDSSVDWMSFQITKRLEGVHPDGKNIVVPKETILSVCDSFYQGTQLTVEMLQEMVVMFIVEQIRNDYQVTKQNDSLSIWVTKYDLESGLKRFNGIKLNEKKRAPYFYWNY